MFLMDFQFFLGFNAINLNLAINQISAISLTGLVISITKYHGNNNNKNQSTERITKQPVLLRLAHQSDDRWFSNFS